MQKTDGRGGLRSGARYYFFRYVASGITSEARWKFGANRSSFKGGTDKRTLQLYIIEDEFAHRDMCCAGCTRAEK